MPEQNGYKTPQEAVIAAMTEAVPQSEKYEYAGVIYEMDGRFFYTKPESSRQTDRVKVKISYPKGANLVSLYHTHPEGEKSEIFTRDDIEMAEKLTEHFGRPIPYFMGHVKDGSVRSFIPGKSEITGRHTSPGEFVYKLFQEEPAADLQTKQHQLEQDRLKLAQAIAVKGSRVRDGY